MLLAIDIGNTNITLGLFPAAPAAPRRSGPPAPPKALQTWRLSTRSHLTADDYGPSLRSLLQSAGLDPDRLAGVAVASVVPALDPVFREVADRYLGRPALFVGPGVATGVRVLVDAPAEVGADRIVNAAAAFARKRRACIVVDFGTATTFDCVSAGGDYRGGVIAPGPVMAAEGLARRTAKLPHVGVFRRPARALGTNTLDSIAAGLYHGYVGLTREILRRLLAEMKGRPAILATGGLAPLIGPEIGDIKEIVPDLTLEGLWLIWRLNQGKHRGA
jgi:type III pantothenate kinase